MPAIRDGRGVLTEYENPLPASNPSGPIERLREPSAMVRVPDVTGQTNAARQAASRARGAKAGGFVIGATKAARRWNGGPIEEGRAHAAEPVSVEAGGGPGPRPSQVGKKRSPEARANMAAAQRAIWERKRAAKAATETAPGIAQEYSAPDPAPEPVVVAEPDVLPGLPCLACAHAAVCSIRSLVEALAAAPRPASPHPAISIEARIVITCAHFLEVVL